MAELKVGDRVRIKDRPDWPSPPGYVLANAEGKVFPGFRLANAEGTPIRWIQYEEAMQEFQDFVPVQIEKAQGQANAYVGSNLWFRTGELEKI